MALPSDVQVGKFVRYFQKFLSIKGTPGPLTVGTELSPQIQPDRYEESVNAYSMSWNQFGFGIIDGPTAAVNAAVRLRNPTTTVVALVTMITVFSGTAFDEPTVQLTSTNADLNTVLPVGQAGRLDARQGAQGSSMIQSRANTVSAPSLTTILALGLPAANTTLLIQPPLGFPLLPGDAIQVRAGVVNQSLGVSFVWRERLLEESERA